MRKQMKKKEMLAEQMEEVKFNMRAKALFTKAIEGRENWEWNQFLKTNPDY